MTWQQRVDCYTAFCDARGYPPALAMAGDWCFGVWVLGNNYRSKQGYHGEFPRAQGIGCAYLKKYAARRVLAYHHCQPKERTTGKRSLLRVMLKSTRGIAGS